MSEQPPKKKRRQNVACDPCKLRRIKCDLLTLLSSLDSTPSSSSSTENEPAHLLVRRYPGMTCTQCRNKGLQCSTEGILNPIKPNKGGKRIEEARKKFGGDPTIGTPIVAEYDETGMDWMSQGATDNLLDQLGIGQSGQGDIGASTDQQDTGFTNQWPTGSTPSHLSSSSGPHPQSSNAFPPLGADLYNQLLNELMTDIGTDPQDLVSQEYDQTRHRHQSSPHSRADIQRQALETWERLSVNTPQTIANRSSRPSTPPLVSEIDMNAHTSHADTLLPALGRLDIETNTFLPVVPLDSGPVKSASGAKPGEPYGRHTGHPGIIDSMIRYGPSPITQAVGQNGKRQRMDESGETSPDSTSFELLNPWERDPWHIWQAKDQVGARTVAWSRKDQVQESLADKALGMELSRHLITVYFQAVHYSLPVLSPESFYIEWEACGRRADRMSPASEALCAVLEAWASRYSDNPAILGLPYQHAHTAPKVITANGQFTPGTQARAHWGKARLPVCNALLDRAGRVIDANSLMRRPSVTGLQALSLYNQLMHMSDQGSRVKDQWIQNMMVHSTVVEQMKLLQMFWTTGNPIATSEDPNTDTLELRMKQRRLFWTTAVSDSCWASATGLPPKIPLEELEAGRAWVDEVLANLPDSTMKMLAFFMKIWHRLAMVGRTISLEITKYNDKKGNISIQAFCASVQQCWGEIRSIGTEFNESALGLLGACEPGVVGFSPLNYITNMRLCCPFFLLVIHEAIRNHLAFRQSFYSSYVVEPESEERTTSQREQDRELLNKVHLQSVDVLLYNCRSQVEMFKNLLPTGIIQSASIMIRVLIASGQFMAEVPTNEQGYPASTLGGYDWTWDEKQRCISICTEALYQIGWAWSDVTDVLEAIHLSMERMTPSPDVIRSYQGSQGQGPINVNIQLQRSRAMRIEQDGLQAALRFWPPKSIPLIVASSFDGFMDEPEKRSSIPRGIPGWDLGQHSRLRLQETRSTETSIPSTSYSAKSSHPTIPGNLGKTPLSDTIFDFPTSSPLTSSAARPNDMMAETSLNAGGKVDTFDDQAFWNLMNGDQQDLDFATFLQSITEDGSVIQG